MGIGPDQNNLVFMTSVYCMRGRQDTRTADCRDEKKKKRIEYIGGRGYM